MHMVHVVPEHVNPYFPNQCIHMTCSTNHESKQGLGTTEMTSVVLSIMHHKASIPIL